MSKPVQSSCDGNELTTAQGRLLRLAKAKGRWIRIGDGKSRKAAWRLVELKLIDFAEMPGAGVGRMSMDIKIKEGTGEVLTLSIAEYFEL